MLGQNGKVMASDMSIVKRIRYFGKAVSNYIQRAALNTTNDSKMECIINVTLAQ